MSVDFIAGRFKVECFVGPENGGTTWLVELHRNGSGEEVGRLMIDKDDLPDLDHILKRAIFVHANYRIERKP